MHTKSKNIIPRRIGFLCSGNGGLFRKTCEACRQGWLKSDIAACIADRVCGSQDVAKEFQIPEVMVERKAYETREAFSDAVLEALRSHDIDLVVLTFDSLLTGAVLRQYENRMINVHLSLLPAFPGFGGLKKAVQRGVRFGGVTLHWVDETTDEGPILSQSVVPIAPQDDAATYGRRLFEAGWPQLVQMIRWYEEGRVTVDEKNHPFIQNADYHGRTTCPALELADVMGDEMS